MLSKHYFEQFKDQIQEEHDKFSSHLESITLPDTRCNHHGKVKIVDGVLRCKCGAAWGGSQLQTLYDLFNRVI